MWPGVVTVSEEGPTESLELTRLLDAFGTRRTTAEPTAVEDAAAGEALADEILAQWFDGSPPTALVRCAPRALFDAMSARLARTWGKLEIIEPTAGSDPDAAHEAACTEGLLVGAESGALLRAAAETTGSVLVVCPDAREHDFFTSSGPVAPAPPHTTWPTHTILDAIGDTPLVRLRGATGDLPDDVEVWAKCEWLNPGGSVKDRAARQMVRDAFDRGALTGRTIIDATSGNTGIALAMIGAVLGVPVTLVMPSNASAARTAAMKGYGAEIIYSSPMEGTDGAIRRCDEIVAQHPERWFRPDQYSNPSNPRAHELTTGPEIVRDTHGRITHFVAGIGTSGTVMGTTRYLKAHVPGVACIAAEPGEELHGLEGWKHMASAIVPALWQPGELDEILPVPTDEGWDTCDQLMQADRLFVGRGGGAAVWAALQVAHREAAAGRPAVIVTILPDGGERYLDFS